MQNRYKINSSNEGRKSSTNTAQPHKADTLSYINLLDKCTRNNQITQRFLDKTGYGYEINSKQTMKRSIKYLNKPRDLLVTQHLFRSAAFANQAS